MTFDWKEESKERYFRKAEEQIEAAGFTDILEIDRGAFATVADGMKVYLKPINRSGHTKRWWEAKRMIENLSEQKTQKDNYGRKQKTIFIHGYMTFEPEECDK